jgi:hypothetical protein
MIVTGADPVTLAQLVLSQLSLPIEYTTDFYINLLMAQALLISVFIIINIITLYFKSSS